MKKSYVVALAAGLALVSPHPISATERHKAGAPVAGLAFTPDPDWLKLPSNWLIGDLSAVAVDRHDNVWILHRPRTIAEADRARAAPPILQFAPDGRYLRGFGGPGEGYEWPTNEHSLAIDASDRLWISGNYRGSAAGSDDMILAFTADGKFLRQIGHRGGTKGGLDPDNMNAPADIFVDAATREVYVADGYGNRRAIVYDSETGAFKRMWSAFGSRPPAERGPAVRVAGQPFTPDSGEGPDAFNVVHGIELSRDGLVYVSDRNNQRVQVFTRAGSYVKQGFVNRNKPSPLTASGLALSADPGQRYLYVADLGNAEVVILDRRSMRTVGLVGGKGTGPGQFTSPHLLATDSKGNVFVADVLARQLRRFVPVDSKP